MGFKTIAADFYGYSIDYDGRSMDDRRIFDGDSIEIRWVINVCLMDIIWMIDVYSMGDR